MDNVLIDMQWPYIWQIKLNKIDMEEIFNIIRLTSVTGSIHTYITSNIKIASAQKLSSLQDH